MKIGLGKRILMFLHWLGSLLICAALIISIYFPSLLADAKALFITMFDPYGKIGLIAIGIIAALIYAFLCVFQASLIFGRRTPRSERGFITVDSSDNSRVRIAISAIEQMVRQSVYSIDGISDMKIAIESVDDAIEINVNASILAGRHVPTITMNMQQAIRKFVELNCGVAVRTVAVNIHAVTSPDAAGKKRHRGKNGKGEPVIVPAPFEASSAAAEPVPAETEAYVEPVSEIVPETADEPSDEGVALTETLSDEAFDAEFASASEEPAGDEENTEKQE